MTFFISLLLFSVFRNFYLYNLFFLEFSRLETSPTELRKFKDHQPIKHFAWIFVLPFWKTCRVPSSLSLFVSNGVNCGPLGPISDDARRALKTRNPDFSRIRSSSAFYLWVPRNTYWSTAYIKKYENVMLQVLFFKI